MKKESKQMLTSTWTSRSHFASLFDSTAAAIDGSYVKDCLNRPNSMYYRSRRHKLCNSRNHKIKPSDVDAVDVHRSIGCRIGHNYCGMSAYRLLNHISTVFREDMNDGIGDDDDDNDNCNNHNYDDDVKESSQVGFQTTIDVNTNITEDGDIDSKDEIDSHGVGGIKESIDVDVDTDFSKDNEGGDQNNSDEVDKWDDMGFCTVGFVWDTMVDEGEWCLVGEM